MVAQPNRCGNDCLCFYTVWFRLSGFLGLIPDCDDDVMDEVGIPSLLFPWFHKPWFNKPGPKFDLAKMELVFMAPPARICERTREAKGRFD